ncbi:MAG: YebC/PmpR family DNA-binding transcriptional regulator [Verrucomicrobiales bacterium]|nr:YebC/PmpR family DNA-binding transcriptional regulator [Verrucomicrobiales bacterium]
MGAQWKQKWRELHANKKGQLVGKLVKEIQVAAQLGGGDPDLNARLAAALEKARKNSVTRDTIERAIKVGTGEISGKGTLETILYEGFAPHRVPVIVECLTDNRNRTASEIKVLFKAGSFGSPGSVAYLFDHIGIIEATHPQPGRDLEVDAIEAGASEVSPLEADEIPPGEAGARFITEPKGLSAASKWLAQAGWKLLSSALCYDAKTHPPLTEAQAEEVGRFLHALDGHDDVHAVFAAVR